ncbi:hypothetical protein ABTP04_15615, partial [Acinetobacter baumannii]
MTWAPHIEEFTYISNISLIPLLKVKGLSSRRNIISKISSNDEVIYAELSGDFPLGDSRQPTYKSLRPF